MADADPSPTTSREGLREALDQFEAGSVMDRLERYATNPDDPLHADIYGLLTAFRAALAASPSLQPDPVGLRHEVERFGDLVDEAADLTEPSPEYEEWTRRAAGALGNLVVVAFRLADIAEGRS